MLLLLLLEIEKAAAAVLTFLDIQIESLGDVDFGLFRQNADRVLKSGPRTLCFYVTEDEVARRRGENEKTKLGKL